LTLPNILNIKAIIYENEQEAQSYIAAKHTKPETKRWETIEQYNKGIGLRKIALNVSEDVSKVKEKIKQFGLFKEVFDEVRSNYPDILIENINILPLVTKFMPHMISEKGDVGLCLTFDQDKLRYFPVPDKGDIYKKNLLKIGEAFFVCNKAPKGNSLSERANSPQYRISTDEIKTKKAVEKLIMDDKRIPGLNGLIDRLLSEDFLTSQV
jgi:hypothetical protein